MERQEEAAAVDLGWSDDRPLTGRRKIQHQKLKKKLKAGSFGEEALHPARLQPQRSCKSVENRPADPCPHDTRSVSMQRLWVWPPWC